MASFNKVILLGNLTRDPEIRSMPSGQSVCKFSIAVSRSYKGKDGDKKEETSFIDIESWGNQAETIAKYFSKGKPIMLEGRLKLDQWTDKATDQKRSKLGVVLENFTFVSGRSDDDQGSLASRESSPTAAAPSDDDSDCPF